MKLSILKLPVFFSTIVAAIYLGLTGCGVTSEGYFMPALGLNEGRILVANAVANPLSYTVTMYDLEGRFIQVVVDTSLLGVVPRGFALYDPFNVVLSTFTPAALQRLNLFTGELTTYATSSLVTGAIYDTIRQSPGVYLTVEASTIEKFVNGARVPPSGATPYINTALGACTISNARGLAINNQGNLLVTSFTNSRILLYDISSSTASCLTSDASFGAQQPIPIVVHPNGKLYFGTQVNDAIYEAPEDLSSGPSLLLSADANINNPVAMAVLPNGNLIVASDGIDSIIEMTPGGVVVNSSFIKNAFTGTVSALIVIPPQ